MAATLFASLMLFAVSSSAQTLAWGEMGLIGGLAGSLLSLRPYLRLIGRLSGHQGVPRFWQGIAFILLFAFWFSAALALNTAWSWGGPTERIEGIVTDKSVSRGRYSNSYYVHIDSPKGPLRTMVPKDVWSDLPAGRRIAVSVCPGALGYPYVVTGIDRGPFLDLKRLLGLRRGGGDAEC